MSLSHVILVALGGALGSVCRHLVGVASLRLLGPGFPWGTLAVNVVGSFLMGAFVALLALRFGGSNQLRLFVAVGFLGGFTTLSSFSLDAYSLWERGATIPAAAYVAGSVVLSLAGLVAGLSIVRTLS
jgi:CrcB protein